MSTLKNPLTETMISRRGAVALGAGTLAALSLSACSSGSSSAPKASSDTGKDLDVTAYDKLVAGGDTAKDDVISANKWATAVKAAGTLRVGGVMTDQLFALKNESDGKIRGFDAGLYQLLTRYILGDESKYEFTQVTSSTRESVLQNDQVDTVVATYSITDKRKQLISFAGPYYTTQQAVLVAAANDTIKSADDLGGKNVAVQEGSTAPTILEEMFKDKDSKPTLQQFKTSEEARQALEQGRVDAYVIDETNQMSSIIKNPGKFKIVGEPFGPKDNFGIGMQQNSEGIAFVNAFLKEIESNGTWKNLWTVCIGDRLGLTAVPEPPAIEG